MTNTVGEYLEKMRARHPRLSMREMSLEAGLSSSVVGQIVAGRSGISPITIRKLCDRWGRSGDYSMLMALAGYPLPDYQPPRRISDDDHGTIDDLLADYRRLDREYQQHLIKQARALLLAQLAREAGIKPNGDEPAARSDKPAPAHS